MDSELGAKPRDHKICSGWKLLRKIYGILRVIMPLATYLHSDGKMYNTVYKKVYGTVQYIV